MEHWISLPVLLPGMLAAFILLALRHHLALARIFSVAGTLAFTALAVFVAARAAGGAVSVYALGDWPVPFGIVLVGDRLSTLMLVVLGVLAPIVLVYAIATGWDRLGRHFHALFQFQLMGLSGAFLTGDLFNLFVFFEVLLIASYGLLIHSGGAFRLRVGVQYVVYNLLGSTLFLFALGTIYAAAGTLNMADLAARMAEMPEGGTVLIRVGAVLLLMVFAVKAAILPLHFWLPLSYAAAPGPVAALFAIMTKVGAYSIIRVYTLVFHPGQPPVAGLVDLWLMPAALATLAVGMIGILASRDLGRLAAFAVLGSMGNLLVAVALFTEEATGVALYYLSHSVFASALLFLVADLTARGRQAGASIVPGPGLAHGGLISAAFFAGAIALVGLPPLSGFIGKLLVLDAAAGRPDQALIWAVILGASLIGTLGFARAGTTLYWKPSGTDEKVSWGPNGTALGCAGLALAVPVALAVFAGPAMSYMAGTAAQLHDRQVYIDAVLGHETRRGARMAAEAAAEEGQSE